jgi:hypothetical protein
MTDQEFIATQHALAETGSAVNQCSCGSYRADGQPPILHNPGCSAKPAPASDAPEPDLAGPTA